MSSGVFFGSGSIQVPRYDQEFVEQASKPIYEVLGLEQDKCCSFIFSLEKDHRGISEICKKALVPVVVKKTNQDFFYEILPFALLVLVAGLCLNYHLNPYSIKVHPFSYGVALGAVGTSMIMKIIETAREKENMKKKQIAVPATMEKEWLYSQLPQINKELAAANEKVRNFLPGDFDKQANKDTIAQRDQLLLLKSYVTNAVSGYRS